MISVCEHEKTKKMKKPLKNRANIIKSELTTSSVPRRLGTLLGPKLNPWESYERSRELSWGALGAIERRLGAQKDTKRASRVLKAANGDPSNSLEKPCKNELLSS